MEEIIKLFGLSSQQITNCDNCDSSTCNCDSSDCMCDCEDY